MSAQRCSCCPHGYHIDLDFVTFAEQVAAGKRMTGRAEQIRRDEERRGTSPVTSLISDSLENMMSDLEEVLGGRQSNTSIRRHNGGFSSAHSTLMRTNQLECNGYMSDSTLYTTHPLSLPSGFSSISGPPKPSMTRSRTPQQPVYSTALARALSSTRLRPPDPPMADSPNHFLPPTPSSRMFSSPLPTREEHREMESSHSSTYRHHVPITPIVQSALNRSEPQGLPPLGHSTLTSSPSSSTLNDMHSMRRGRQPDPITPSRQRYYSSSPKMPRRLVPVSSTMECPDFCTPARPSVLNSMTSTPVSPNEPSFVSPTYSSAPTVPCTPARDIRDASCWTGPPTPVKPCLECLSLRREVEELNLRLNYRPDIMDYCMQHDEERPEQKEKTQQTEKKEMKEAVVATERIEREDRGADAEIMEEKEWNDQATETVHPRVENRVSQTEEKKKETEEKGTSPLAQPIPRDTMETGTDAPLNTDTVEIASQTDDQSCIPMDISYPSSSPYDLILIPPISPLQSTPQKEVQESCTPQHSPMSDPPPDYDVIEEAEMDEVEAIMERKMEKEDEKMEKEDEKMEKDEKIEEEKVDVNGEETKKIGEDEVESLKKLLVSEEPKAFVRGGIFRSLRATRTTKSQEDDDEEHNSSTDASTPSEKVSDALKGKLALKKDQSTSSVVSKIPEPQNARIPRPKISKYAADVTHIRAETEDEEEEAADRLTPLRSELRSLGSWPGTSNGTSPATSIPPPIQEEVCSDSESDGSEGSYETNEQEDDTPFEPSEPLLDAIKTLDRHVSGEKQKQESVEWAMKLVQHEWLKTAARRGSKTDKVSGFVEAVTGISQNLHEFIINIDDSNANTALHYAVSHGNIPVASLLLDYNAQVDCANRAGYSPLMLAALVDVQESAEINIVHRLFRAGDVNARAQPHGQTALMLAVSHGKLETAKLLLECGADVNVQDEEGSTALMCAAEHGHKALVKVLLAHSGIDASLSDCDSSTALSIAVENGHRDIGLLLYAHQKRTNESV